MATKRINVGRLDTELKKEKYEAKRLERKKKELSTDERESILKYIIDLLELGKTEIEIKDYLDIFIKATNIDPSKVNDFQKGRLILQARSKREKISQNTAVYLGGRTNGTKNKLKKADKRMPDFEEEDYIL